VLKLFKAGQTLERCKQETADREDDDACADADAD
jgi:hypothetical protein